MGKSIDLDSFHQIISSESEQLRKAYLKLVDNSIKFNSKNQFSEEEVIGLANLSQNLLPYLNGNQKRGFFINCEVGIGISQQFDVLRFSDDHVLNIELKYTLPDEGLEKVLYQLKQHKFLLNMLNRKVSACTYVYQSNKIYLLNEDDELIIITLQELSNLISNDYIDKNMLLQLELSDLIISPYTEPVRFKNHKYFLSDEQITRKKDISKSEKNKFGLIGGPGTGKSMLLFDLAYEYKDEGKKVVVIFCAQLENHDLISKYLEIKVIEIRSLSSNYQITDTGMNYLESYDVILVDEAQRLSVKQYDLLLSLSEKLVVFSTDHQQTLHPSEKEANIQEKLCGNKEQIKILNLKNKVRTDVEMSSFIQKLLNLNARNVDPYEYKNINVTYFCSIDEARMYIREMCVNENYTSIELTEYITKSTRILKRKNNYECSESTHSVIGKEYDNVLVPLDKHFKYDENKRLVSTYSEYYPYHEDSQIFEALTRVRKKLLIVVIDNIELYATIQRILTWRSDRLANKRTYDFEKNYESWEEAFEHLAIINNKSLQAQKVEFNEKKKVVKVSYIENKQ